MCARTLDRVLYDRCCTARRHGALLKAAVRPHAWWHIRHQLAPSSHRRAILCRGRLVGAVWNAVVGPPESAGTSLPVRGSPVPARRPRSAPLAIGLLGLGAVRVVANSVGRTTEARHPWVQATGEAHDSFVELVLRSGTDETRWGARFGAPRQARREFGVGARLTPPNPPVQGKW